MVWQKRCCWHVAINLIVLLSVLFLAFSCNSICTSISKYGDRVWIGHNWSNMSKHVKTIQNHTLLHHMFGYFWTIAPQWYFAARILLIHRPRPSEAVQELGGPDQYFRIHKKKPYANGCDLLIDITIVLININNYIHYVSICIQVWAGHGYVLAMSWYCTAGNPRPFHRIKAGPGPSAWILCGKSLVINQMVGQWDDGWWISAASPQHLEASWIHWFSLIPLENLEIAQHFGLQNASTRILKWLQGVIWKIPNYVCVYIYIFIYYYYYDYYDDDDYYYYHYYYIYIYLHTRIYIYIYIEIERVWHSGSGASSMASKSRYTSVTTCEQWGGGRRRRSQDPKTVCGENTKPQNRTGMIQWICWMLSRWKALLVLIVNIFLASLILWNAACQANWVFLWRTNMRQSTQGDPPSSKLVYKPIQL